MGMYDESWCNGCGKSVPYSDNEETYCGKCAEKYAQETPQKLVKLIEYMKLHLISLEQDSDELNTVMVTYEDLESDEYKDMEVEDISLNGQMIGIQHVLSVASDILASSNERE